MEDASTMSVGGAGSTVGIGPENEPATESAHDSAVTRRQFLGAAAGASILVGFPWRPGTGEVRGEVPHRTLGRTGERVSAIGIGGFHLGKPELPESESIRIIRAAIDNGINFLDNCWDYNEGQSEIRMGKALHDGYRQRAFLMTKIDGRDKKTAAQQIFCHGRSHRSGTRGEEGGEDPLHRVHRAQESRHPLKNAPYSREPSIPFRCGSDAAERHGRAL